MSASSALQKVIIAALLADSGVAQAVGNRVFDRAPKGVRYPYVSLGPSSFFPERRDCMTARVETVQLDVWARNNERRQPCKAICDAVEAALDMADLSLEDPYGLGRFELRLSRVLDDPDGITTHGVMQFEAEVTY
ncbi:hypothetical protein GGQ68_002510 [Sagittula marina]|uniref:DUF3168 domain-containing protein n=1 Tax=Sagittula marina TaxID=943940 RepID=A0A7W6DSM6_9RHOB|nr:DUF3168 domain-containing protein [Sagittula marina]MBB3986172.1 hypothetical protein [Sagittula marina]